MQWFRIDSTIDVIFDEKHGKIPKDAQAFFMAFINILNGRAVKIFLTVNIVFG